MHQKDDEYATIHESLRHLGQTSAVALLAYMKHRYPDTWEGSDNQQRSDEKRIKRILEQLIRFGIASREKRGNTYLYQYEYRDEKMALLRQHYPQLQADATTESSYYRQRETQLTLINATSESYYIRRHEENIDKKEPILCDLERAIEQRKKIEMRYHNTTCTVSPLRIALFDGYWYLIAEAGGVRSYRIQDIQASRVLSETYPQAFQADLDLDTWLNIWHSSEKKPTTIRLLIDKTVIEYFSARNLLGYKDAPATRKTPVSDGVEYELDITHVWEALPTLMQWQLYLTILDQDGAIDLMGAYRDILNNANSRYTPWTTPELDF